MVSLAGNLPLGWPPTLENMFEWFNVVSSAGSNLLIPDCELSELKTAEVFYMKQIFFACFPPLVVAVCPLSKRLSDASVKTIRYWEVRKGLRDPCNDFGLLGWPD